MQLGYTQEGDNTLLIELNAYIKTQGLPFFSLDGRVIDDIGVQGMDKDGVSKIEYGHTIAWADISTPDNDGVYFIPSVESMRGIWKDVYLDGTDDMDGIIKIEHDKAAELGLDLVEYTRPVIEDDEL